MFYIFFILFIICYIVDSLSGNLHFFLMIFLSLTIFSLDHKFCWVNSVKLLFQFIIFYYNMFHFYYSFSKLLLIFTVSGSLIIFSDFFFFKYILGS